MDRGRGLGLPGPFGTDMGALKLDVSAVLTVILAALVLALAGWCWRTNERLQAIEDANKIHDAQEETHEELETRIRKFWRIHAWSKDEINWLRRLHDLDMANWPD